MNRVDSPELIAPKLNSFVAFVDSQARSAQPAWAVPSLSFQTTMATAGHTVTICFGERDMLTTSADGQCTLLLAGEIYRPQTPNAGERLLDLYEQQGLDFVQGLNGAFCLLLIDRRADVIAVATDKENTFKVLVSDFDGRLVISNSIYLQPVRGARIDQTALACYMAAGYVFNDRTLFEGVRVLDSSSVYSVQDHTLKQHKYWQYRFPSSTRNVPVSTLQHELGDLIVEAVRVRIKDDQPTYVSLTAGTDSRAILGVLADHLHLSDVQCFTYAYGAVKPGTDEQLAGKLAALCGYPHAVIPSFDGDVVNTLKRNGRLGGGMAQVCDEVDAWIRLGASLDSDTKPVLLTGDTRFVGLDFRMKTDNDAAAGAFMTDFTALAWLEQGIGSAAYREFVAATQAEIDLAVKRLSPTENRFDLRDLLRFYQVHSRRTATWREYYSSRFFRTAHPFLDDDILEFFCQLPSSLRREKRLYLETVTRMFPRLFALPLATSASYASFWQTAIRDQRAGIRSLLQGEPSPLDEIIAPEFLLALLAAEDTSLRRSKQLARTALKKTYHLLKRTGLGDIGYVAPSLFHPAVSVQTFLTRALTLRCFLSEIRHHPLILPSVVS